MMQDMRVREVTTFEDAQQVRLIRNSVARFMTNNAKQISSYEQERWFITHKETHNRLFLFSDVYQSPLGYGYIAYRDEQAWGTLAVYPEFQSMGYGSDIYGYLLGIVSPEPLWIEIFADNNPSLIAALRNNFQIVQTNDKIVTLKGTP